MISDDRAVKPITRAPANRNLPFVGETLSFLRDPTAFIIDRSRAHGNVFITKLFGKNTVALLGADANRFILSDGMHHFCWKDGWPPNFQPLLGDALFLQDGPEHRRKRNLLMPAFHAEAIAGYLNTIEAHLLSSFERWEHRREFAFYDEFHRLTFDVSSQLLLGADFGEDRDRLNLLINRWVAGLVALPLPLPWTAFGRALRVRKELLAFVRRAIAQRKASPRADALGLLVKARDDQGAPLSTEELESQALFLVAAGYATTTSLLTYLVYALASEPAVLARARAEQGELGIEGAVTLEDVRRMAYLDNVVSEVERQFPPVSFGFRGVVEPFEFQNFAVPAGWQVLFSIDATHHDARYFPDPDRFDPDRFAGHNTDRNAFRLIGFGGGPRVCIGMMLARTQVKVVASHLLRRYAWDLKPDQDLKVSFVPARRPRGGLPVTFRRLDGT